MFNNLLDRVKSIFTTDEDQETLKEMENRISDLQDIQITMESEGGKKLKKMLVNDFFITLEKLFETREEKYISDLKSITDLINKLNVNQELDEIRQYLEDKLN
ncbi:MAG: hypothetical protein CSYNP_03118 [Syntrophus sp. SKADARSKE-3]|nr:hypothetical protein [Syntrophus sp. SKADARSKE-3]